MSAGIALVLAPAVVAVLLLFIADIIDKEHFALKLLLVLFALFCCPIIAEGSYDAQETCELFPSRVNITDHHNESGLMSSTIYEYSEQCTTTIGESSVSLFKLSLWIIRLVIIYSVMFFGYHVLNWLKENAKL